MFVYNLSEPIDYFDGLTPLNEWISTGHAAQRTAWALKALLALADAASQVRWEGDMRDLPMVGCLPTPPDVTPYLVVKQDNNGETFVVTTTSMHSLVARREHRRRRNHATPDRRVVPHRPDPADEPEF